MSKSEKPFSPITAEQDLDFMRRNSEKVIKQVGETEYKRMVKQLEDHIRGRKRPGQAADSKL